MARKRAGRRERMLAKALAVRNEAVIRFNARNAEANIQEAREQATARTSKAYDAKRVLGRTHVVPREIWNLKGSEQKPKPTDKPAPPKREKLVKRTFINRKRGNYRELVEC